LKVLKITLKIYQTLFVELIFEVFSFIHPFSVNDPQRDEFVDLLQVRPREKNVSYSKNNDDVQKADRGGGISFMITKQGSLSIIKTISKTKAAHYRLGRTRVVPRHEDAVKSAREILDDSSWRVEREIIIERYRSSHVDKLKMPRLRVRVRTRVVGRYLYIVTSCNITSVHIWNYCSPYLVRFS